MKRAQRMVVCAVTVLAVSGVGADAYAHPGQRYDDHRHHAGLAHDGSPHVLLALGRLDRRLGGSLRHRLAPLTQADRAALRGNATSDQSTVESVATALSNTPNRHHLKRAEALLRTYHPVRYVGATAILSRSARTAASVVALQALVEPASTDALQLSTAADLLARIRAHGFSARTRRARMREARRVVRVARGLVSRVRSDLAAAR